MRASDARLTRAHNSQPGARKRGLVVHQDLIIESTEREYARTAWLIEGPKKEHSLCVLLNGEDYRDPFRRFQFSRR